MCRDQLYGNDHFAVHPRKQDEFLITHYAGDVNYSTAGFLDKNKDMLNIGESHTTELLTTIAYACRPVAAACCLSR